MSVNTALLGNWLKSWVTDKGEIYGFHNHSVWGDNPYRYADFTSGHSTFASPFLPALSYSLSQCMDSKGYDLLLKLIKFQTSSFQENNQFNHIGFQVGETAKIGLIHNVVADVSLGLTALYGKDYLPKEYLENIKSAILRNLDGCKVYGNGRPDNNATCNQDYTRIWSKLIFMKAFNDYTWMEEIIEDINFMIKSFHKTGFPDECEGTYRCLNDKHQSKAFIEPAEYYGLMINPLLLMYELTKDIKYLNHSKNLCLHISRSSWIDDNGQTRFHRIWLISDNKHIKIEKPMLIAGVGLTLLGIMNYLKYEDNHELKEFLDNYNSTYAYYQTKTGYFVSATGWQSEVDIAPSTAWHTHDFLYLVQNTKIDNHFWNLFNSKYDKVSILLGEQCFWIENNNKWAILDYVTQNVFYLAGKKDKNHFGRELLPWICKKNTLEDCVINVKPKFIKTDDGIYQMDNNFQDADIYSIASLEYKGIL